MKKTQAGLWVLGFDKHYPFIHKPTFNALKHFLKENPVRGYVFGGDQHDNGEISHHNKRRIIFKETGSYRKNTDGFERDVLRPIIGLLPKDATKVWIKGNHEHWERQLIEESPELEGTIERDKLYALSDRGFVVCETGVGFDIGKLHVIHGETLKGTHHAKNAVETYAQSVAYGHFHTVQSFTKILPQAKTDKWVGYACPAMCSLNPIYLRNAPHQWLNGIGIVEVRADGNFNLTQAVVTNGIFTYGGKTYGNKTV